MTRYLVALVLIAGIGYWGYSARQDHLESGERQRAREARQHALKLAVADMASRTNAVTDWTETLAGAKKMSRGPILTAELQRLWLQNRPVLFVGSVRDVAIDKDHSYQVTIEYNQIGGRPMFLDNEIRVSLLCPESFATQLTQTIMANKSLSFYADTAVIASIEKVETSIEKGAEGDTVRVLTGVGKCMDAMQLTERISW